MKSFFAAILLVLSSGSVVQAANRMTCVGTNGGGAPVSIDLVEVDKARQVFKIIKIHASKDDGLFVGGFAMFDQTSDRISYDLFYNTPSGPQGRIVGQQLPEQNAYGALFYVHNNLISQDLVCR